MVLIIIVHIRSKDLIIKGVCNRCTDLKIIIIIVDVTKCVKIITFIHIAGTVQADISCSVDLSGIL